MNFAEQLRNELKDKTTSIIANEFEPRKEKIFSILATGIKRIGYVKIDTFNHTGTYEGNMLGINDKNIEAFAKFLTDEGFKVQKSWWGFSSDGVPDMLKIWV